VRLVGVELYFDDLERAKRFYLEELGLDLDEEQAGRYAKLGKGPFLCLERKGTENYASREKAVVFLEVRDLAAEVARLGRGRFVRVEARWAVLHDPEGHNVLLIERSG
jgi:predicted enzyme related to lactoylglutathione lyase